MTFTVQGITIPDSQMARDTTLFIRDSESDLLFHHSSRVYYWAALAARRREIKVDHELLYVGCMFHDIGLTHEHCSCDKRFEVDGANAAREFMQGYGVTQSDMDKVWTAIALHTTPGIPEFMAPEIAMVTAGVEMDVLGIDYDRFSEADRTAVVEQHPRISGHSQDSRDIVASGLAGDESQAFTLAVWVELVSEPLAHAVNILGPHKIVAGGGLATEAKLLGLLDKAVRRKVLLNTTQPLIVAGQYTRDGGLMGASVLGRKLL